MSHAHLLKVQHLLQQQTASTNQSVAHTGALEEGGGRRRWIPSIRLPLLPLPTPSAGLITLIDRRVLSRRKPSCEEQVGPSRWSRWGGGGRRDRCCAAAHDAQKKVRGRMRKFRSGIDGYTPTVLVLDRSSGSSTRRGPRAPVSVMRGDPRVGK